MGVQKKNNLITVKEQMESPEIASEWMFRLMKNSFRSQKIEKRKEDGRCPLNNFTKQFKVIRSMAAIEDRDFHDLRKTCLSNWLAGGLSEYEVMILAGHAKFETTHRFYLAVSGDLLEHARAIAEGQREGNFVARLLLAPLDCHKRKRLISVSAYQP